MKTRPLNLTVIEISMLITGLAASRSNYTKKPLQSGIHAKLTDRLYETLARDDNDVMESPLEDPEAGHLVPRL